MYIVRHAESTGNLPKELRTGGIDPHLTELGQKQADLLGKRMAGRKFDYIVSFPMTRTLQTTGRHRQIYGYSSGASLDRSGGAGCGGFSGDFPGISLEEAKKSIPTWLRCMTGPRHSHRSGRRPDVCHSRAQSGHLY
ncbi:MAG TPA: histidine phosphatase family protein [Clostridiales bacterium]|nr:histidine phosphatase family protein [Clostridiales bacterium]